MLGTSSWEVNNKVDVTKVNFEKGGRVNFREIFHRQEQGEGTKFNKSGATRKWG